MMTFRQHPVSHRPHLLLVLLFFVLVVWIPAPAWTKCPVPPRTDQGERKGIHKRNFAKTHRHEVGLFGGLYASELMGHAPWAGANYSFHLNEDFALEVTIAYALFRSPLKKTVEQYTGLKIIEDHDAFVYAGNLVWHPIHGKFMLFGSAIPHFDFYIATGVGITDGQDANSLTYNVGFGIKIYTTSWLSIRLDIRDYILSQEVLSSTLLTNNLTLSLGVGFWIPFSS